MRQAVAGRGSDGPSVASWDARLADAAPAHGRAVRRSLPSARCGAAKRDRTWACVCACSRRLCPPNPARAARRSGIRCRANSVELGGNGFARRNRNSDDARRHGSRAGPSPAIHGGAEEETGSTARPPSEQPAQRSAAATLPPRKPKSGSSRGQTLHGGNKNCRAGNRAATRRGISGRVTAEGAWNAGVVGRARRRAANLRHHIKRIGVSPSNLLSGMPQQNLLLDCSLSRERPGAAGPVVGRCRVVHRVQFNHSTSPKTQA